MSVTNDCDECGFADDDVSMADAVVALRKAGQRYRAPLTRFLPGEDGVALLRERPETGVWSALEYAAHVRDVFANYDQWIRRSLVEDDPVIDHPSPDQAAELGRYNKADPAAVAEGLAANAEGLAATLEGISETDWDRCHVRGQPRSVLFAARRAVHEANHHFLDIGRGMRALRQRGRQES